MLKNSLVLNINRYIFINIINYYMLKVYLVFKIYQQNVTTGTKLSTAYKLWFNDLQMV